MSLLAAPWALLGCGRTDLACDLGDCNDGTGSVMPLGDGGDDLSLDGVPIEPDDGGFVFDTFGDLAPPRGDGSFDAPPDTTCPVMLPRLGASCIAPLECDYSGCDVAKKDHASCKGGKWIISASACASDPTRCPVGIPADYSACTVPSRVGCTWSTSSKCISDMGMCVGGKWSIKHGGCGSSEACPPTFPPKGSACPKTAPGTVFVCSYVNACGLPEETACGEGGVWGAGEPDPTGLPVPCETVAPCPSTEPTAGSLCTGIKDRLECVWKNDCGGFDYGSCGPDWVIWRPPCAAKDCPTTPSVGTSCTTNARSCTYPIGGGCSLVCSCDAGKWACATPPCGGGK